MTDTTRTQPRTNGDAAVDGLLAGGIGGIGMGLYLLALGLTWGDTPALTLGRFDPGGAASPVAGLFGHLAVSAVYGALFALSWRLALRHSRSPVWVAAPLYGLALWAVATFVFLPAAGSALSQIPPLHFALAHIIYGLILGIALNRKR